MAVIQVFEHQKLKVGQAVQGVLFKEHHFEQLALYHEQQENPYFSLVHKGVKFSEYVGVIQCGDLTIEILPKADKLSTREDKSRWHQLLLYMLGVVTELKVSSLSDASLRTRSNSLLDLYFLQFIREVRQLLHQGLIKKYRKENGQQPALKGRLLFEKQLQYNVVHQERFFTSHQVYDYEHTLNQILFKAISIIIRLSHNPDIKAQAQRLHFSFPELREREFLESDFEKIVFNRKSLAYKPAIDIARLIILNLSPDIRGGQEQLLAILFDMNELWERFIYKQLRVAATKNNRGFSVKAQLSKKFWKNQHLKPDIVLEERNEEGETEKTIIDTKWKLLSSLKPSMEDLRQMYAYKIHFGAEESILLYPKVQYEDQPVEMFKKSALVEETYQEKLGVRLMFVDLLKDGKINYALGEELLENLRK